MSYMDNVKGGERLLSEPEVLAEMIKGCCEGNADSDVI